MRRSSFEPVALAEMATLYRVAKRLTLDPTRAEDLVGQTLYQAARAWHLFEGGPARPWLLKILRNEFLGDLRKRRARPEATPLDDSLEIAVEDPLEARFAVDAVLLALDELPEDYRMVVTLCDLEQMPYQDAAEVLEIPVGTVRSRLFRGRKLLRRRLAYLEP